VLVLALGVVACGGGGDDADGREPRASATPTATAAPDETAAATPSAARGVRLRRVGSFSSPVHLTSPPGDRARQFVVEQVAAGSPLDPELIGGVIDAVSESRGSMTIIGFAFLAWSSLGVFSALSGGISRAFENAPPRPFFKDKLVGIILMGVTGALAVASLVIGLVTGVVQEVAADAMTRLPGGGTAIWLIGLIVPILLIFIAFWVIYRVVPNRPVTWGEVLPGAVVAALLWTVLRFGFTYYATNVANYDSAFGPLSTGVTLLVFLYFASLIVLLGAEFARASALEDEVGPIAEADPRLLPVAVDMPPRPAAAPRRGISRWVVLAGGALIGLVAGRLSKRDED